MHFELTPEQQDIKKAAREFAEGEFPDVALEYDKKEEFPMEIWKKACGLGFVGIFIDEEYGGAGMGYLDNALVTEEFWRADPGMGTMLLTTLGSEIILMHGRDDQKKKYLPPLCTGDAIMGLGCTEPDAGSDLTSVSTTAIKENGEYVINGSKIFITNGTIADYLAVFCVTDPDAENPFYRHSLIMVETDRQGFEANKLAGKMGARATITSELSFNDVRVPEGNLVGEIEGKGFYQIVDMFNRTRIAVAAQGIGVAQGALEMAVRYTKKRQQFGKSIASFQGTQFKIAEMATKIEAGRSLYYRAASLLDQGKVEPEIISMAKWYCGETGVRVTDEALQMHGGYGYFEEYNVERFFRAAKIVEIVEGTKDIEKLIIARELLKKIV
jgi:alkylation response protein AidB-like acyl-CoA dehydrogenase